ncbi:MAG: PIN domain-containing protein [Candidatus Acidiferrales bacterium]
MHQRSPSPRKLRKHRPRAVIDTSVLVAGISGFRRPFISRRIPSADALRAWVVRNNFVWLITDDIMQEYKEVLTRLRVRPNLIGKAINLIRERAEEIKIVYSVQISLDPKDDPFCICSEQGNAEFIVTLNPKDFPQDRLKAKVMPPEQFVT